jgi:hypothetical protein
MPYIYEQVKYMVLLFRNWSYNAFAPNLVESSEVDIVDDDRTFDVSNSHGDEHEDLVR